MSHSAREWGNEENGEREVDVGYLDYFYVRVPKQVREKFESEG